MSTASVIWQRIEPSYGIEIASIVMDGTSLHASGAAIGADPIPYWLTYELSTRETFITSGLHVAVRGTEWRRTIDLSRSSEGHWTCKAVAEGNIELELPGIDASRLEGALDCDLGLSPLTNSMPILRHRINEVDGHYNFLMAWVAVPALAVRVSEQRYEFVKSDKDGAIVRYSSGNFSADLRVDSTGLVVEYPGLARRVAIQS